MPQPHTDSSGYNSDNSDNMPDVNKYISFSGGVESTAMCVLWGSTAKAIFCDTGYEHEELYKHIDRVEVKLKALHPGFEIIKVRANVRHAEVFVDNLYDYIKLSQFYPAMFARYCTRMFKIKPIDDFLFGQGECDLMIGLNFNEQDRTGNHGNVQTVNYRYPLIENRITREACKEILKKASLLPQYPPYMSRGGCIGCFFKSKKEFIAMCHFNEPEFDRVMELEEIIQDKRDVFFRIKRDMPRLRELKAEVKQSLFKPEEMYLQEEIFTPCGVFCHR